MMHKISQIAEYKGAKVLPKLYWQHLIKNAAKIMFDFWQHLWRVVGIFRGPNRRQSITGRGSFTCFSPYEHVFGCVAKIRCQNCKNYFLHSRFLCAANNTYYPFRGRYILAALKPGADKKPETPIHLFAK